MIQSEIQSENIDNDIYNKRDTWERPVHLNFFEITRPIHLHVCVLIIGAQLYEVLVDI